MIPAPIAEEGIISIREKVNHRRKTFTNLVIVKHIHSKKGALPPISLSGGAASPPPPYTTWSAKSSPHMLWQDRARTNIWISLRVIKILIVTAGRECEH